MSGRGCGVCAWARWDPAWAETAPLVRAPLLSAETCAVLGPLGAAAIRALGAAAIRPASDLPFAPLGVLGSSGDRAELVRRASDLSIGVAAVADPRGADARARRA